MFWELIINIKVSLNFFFKVIVILCPWTWNSITCNAIVHRPVGECQLSIHRCSKNTDKSPWLPPHDSGSSKSSIYNFQCHQEYCFFEVQICSLFTHNFVIFYDLIMKLQILNAFFSRHWSFLRFIFGLGKKPYAKFASENHLLINYLSFQKQTANFQTKLVFRFCEKKTLFKRKQILLQKTQYPWWHWE